MPALFALIVAATLIAFTPILVRFSEVGPLSTAFWRLFFALPGLALWAYLERRYVPKTTALALPSTPWLVLAGAGFCFAADLATFHTAIMHTTAGNATFFANTTPVIVGFFAWLVLKKPLSRDFLLGVALAVIGGALLSGGAPATGAHTYFGDILGVVAAFWYAAYILLIGKAREGMPTGAVMLITNTVAAVFALPMALVSGEVFFPPPSLTAWGVLVVFGLVVQLGGQGLLAFALGRVDATLASVVILLQPVLAALLGWILFQEAMAALQLAGGAAILVGIWLARRGSN